ncbi:MAG: hypothetical protein ACM35H_04790 [Bacteroidota bacterium]|nr:hypothetical protein [Kiloniellaceae bacterium]
MTAQREGFGRLYTMSGKECAARYLFEAWREASAHGQVNGILRGADPAVALESFRPGEIATLELGSGEMLEVSITALLPCDEIAFAVREQPQAH